jgi:surface antigen
MGELPLTGHRYRLRRLAVAGCLALAGCTGAGTPDVAASLDATDLSLMAETTRSALEVNKVGQASNWVNRASGHRGTATPVRTVTQADGTPCRRFQQTATAGGRTIFAFDSACRRDDGTWISTNYGSLSGAIARSGTPYRTQAPPPYYDDPFCHWPYRDRAWCWPHVRGSVRYR